LSLALPFDLDYFATLMLFVVLFSLFDRLVARQRQLLFLAPFALVSLALAWPGLLPDPDGPHRRVVPDPGHLQVGIVGLVWPAFYRGGEWIAQDPANALRAVLPEIQAQAHLVVVLAQMHLDEALKLAQDVCRPSKIDPLCV